MSVIDDIEKPASAFILFFKAIFFIYDFIINH